MDMNYNLLMIYVCLFLSGFVVMNFLTGGWVLQWWKVKKSRGKLILIHVKNSISPYWKTGDYNNSFIRYKARSRRDNPNPNRMISISEDYLRLATHESWGVKWIEVDDDKGSVYYYDGESYKSVSGFNVEKMDEIVQTALAKPSLQEGLFDTKTFQIIVILGFLLILILGYVVYKRIETNDLNAKMTYDLVKPMYDYMFNSTRVV